MTSFCCGTEAELESRLSELLPYRRSIICYFTATALFLFMILTMEQFVINIMLILIVAVCLIAYILLACRWWQQWRGEPSAAAGYEIQQHNPDQRIHVPPFPTRAQLSDVRIQLALLDRDFDYRDYEALRSLDDDIAPEDPTMSEEAINVLPVHVTDHGE